MKNIIILLLVIAIAFLAWIQFKPKTNTDYKPIPFCGENGEFCPGTPAYERRMKDQSKQAQPTITTDTGVKTYTNNKFGFSLQYPSRFNTSLQNAASNDFDGIDSGTMFVLNFPTDNFKGTNLRSATIFGGVKNVNENSCYFALYGNSTSNETITAPDKIVTRNGITYHVVGSAEGAAGSSYATTRYSTMHNGSCYQLYLVAHSSGNFEAPTVPYDATKLLFPTFNSIIDSFQFAK